MELQQFGSEGATAQYKYWHDAAICGINTEIFNQEKLLHLFSGLSNAKQRQLLRQSDSTSISNVFYFCGCN